MKIRGTKESADLLFLLTLLKVNVELTYVLYHKYHPDVGYYKDDHINKFYRQYSGRIRL